MPNRPSAAPDPLFDRRSFVAGAASAVVLSCFGCDSGADASLSSFGRLEAVWGTHGIVGGRMHKPRAMAIDPSDRLYLVDFTARILAYEADGEFLHGWQTPESHNGRPTGLTFDPVDNELLVADTHYYRVLAYTPDGRLKPEHTIGGVNGRGEGEFGFVTDVARDSSGCYYVSEYGDNDRIQKFSPEREYLLQWGSHGSGELQFKRPNNLMIDPDDRVWVCDACNHRVKVFDSSGELLFAWGTEGSGPGELYYPYDIVRDHEGDLYIAEFGNHRVQKFTPDGQPLGVWGSQGSGDGQLWDPWALVLDSEGRLHVLDTRNHRVQRVEVS
ncbi:NHL repeat-containing protein [Botrimarina sp.]|uniref:NHL repeat-containing protein n=1 Tax=Botrimarina sp. TaxID=2795802 RepID=UPI0032EC15DC